MNQTQKLNLDQLYNQYHKNLQIYLKAICRDAELAEDISQEAFIRVHKSLHTFNPEKGNFLTWLKTIAKNLCIRNLNKSKKYEVNSEKIDLEADERPGIDDGIIKKSLKSSIKNAIECLPEPEKSIVYYKYRFNLTLDEIAERTEISRRTVSRKFISALSILKEKLLDEDINLGM